MSVHITFVHKEIVVRASLSQNILLLEYSLSLTKTMYKVQTKILNNQIIN